MTSKDSLRMILGAVAGFAAAFAMAGVLIMPPSDMARWIGSDEPVRDRLARVFAPPAHIVELRASAAKASNTLAICKADHEEQRRRADDFEFKLSAAAARPEGAPREAAASCARDYASVRGIKLKVGETVRHLGGRIYLGLSQWPALPTSRAMSAFRATSSGVTATIFSCGSPNRCTWRAAWGSSV